MSKPKCDCCTNQSPNLVVEKLKENFHYLQPGTNICTPCKNEVEFKETTMCCKCNRTLTDLEDHNIVWFYISEDDLSHLKGYDLLCSDCKTILDDELKPDLI